MSNRKDALKEAGRFWLVKCRTLLSLSWGGVDGGSAGTFRRGTAVPEWVPRSGKAGQVGRPARSSSALVVLFLDTKDFVQAFAHPAVQLHAAEPVAVFPQRGFLFRGRDAFVQQPWERRFGGLVAAMEPFSFRPLSNLRPFSTWCPLF